MRVIDVTTMEITRYINHRLVEGIANGTINRELAALKRMFNLVANETPPKVDRVPHIQMLPEDNVREGFLEDSEYYAILEKLPQHMKGFVDFAYWTGWRSKQIAEYQNKIKLKFSPFSRQHSPCIPLSGIFSRLH